MSGYRPLSVLSFVNRRGQARSDQGATAPQDPPFFATPHLPPGDLAMITSFRRHAAALAVVLAVAGIRGSRERRRAGCPEGLARRRSACCRAAAPRRRAPKAIAPVPTITKETVENPYGLGSALGAGRLRVPRHADHPRHHVHGQLVHPVHQAVGAVQADARRPRDAARRSASRRRVQRRRQDAEGSAARSASSPKPASRRTSTTKAR